MQLKVDFLNWLYQVKLFLLGMFTSWQFYLVLFLIALPFLFYLNYRFHNRLFRRRAERAEEKRKTEEKRTEIEKLLEKDIDYLSSDELSTIIAQINESIDWIEESENLEEYLDDLYTKRAQANKQKSIASHKEELYTLADKKDTLQQAIRNLELEKWKREREEQDKRDDLLDDLDIHENNVFRREDLSEKQVGALLEEGYFRVNEYCPYEQKMITILVKPKMQHSKTHTFLVWSLKKILEEYPGIKNIQEHLTKDADLTFIYEKQIYALEVEIGTLLGKKEQLKEKLAYLNRKYPNRWMFIVSHRDLLPKYKKFGLAVTRKDVQRALEKLLNSHTRKKRV